MIGCIAGLPFCKSAGGAQGDKNSTISLFGWALNIIFQSTRTGFMHAELKLLVELNNNIVYIKISKTAGCRIFPLV